MKGIFALRSAADLFAKLQVDADRIQSDRTNSYAAFDFCVTAWHLVEWRFPDDARAQRDLCVRNPVLRICEHLAVGAKHFEPQNPKLTAVDETKIAGAWADGAWKAGAWKQGVWSGDLVVLLDGDAKTAFGDSITIEALAKAVLVAWQVEM